MPFTVLKDITILPTLRALFNFSLVLWMYQLLSSVNDFPVSFHFFPISTPGAMIIAQAMTSACHSTIDFDLWTASPASGYLSPSVHPVWSCQADCLNHSLDPVTAWLRKAMTAHTLQRKIQAPQGTVETFCRLLFPWQVEAQAEWSRWGEASDLTESCSNQLAILGQNFGLTQPSAGHPGCPTLWLLWLDTFCFHCLEY